MEHHADGWPAITYQYVMHYFWEPDHLFLKKDEDRLNKAIEEAKKKGQKHRRRDLARDRMQAEEVPLNYFLNVLLRLAPASIRRACLEPFGIDLAESGLDSLVLQTPGEFKGVGLKTQPDVHLESETARVFIEVKIKDKTPLTLQQIEKYVQLHNQLDEAKQRYLLFLVKPNELRIAGVRGNFTRDNMGQLLAPHLSPEAGSVTFGYASWAALAQKLTEERGRRQDSSDEAAEMLQILIGDFLADLERRELAP